MLGRNYMLMREADKNFDTDFEMRLFFFFNALIWVVFDCFSAYQFLKDIEMFILVLVDILLHQLFVVLICHYYWNITEMVNLKKTFIVMMCERFLWMVVYGTIFCSRLNVRGSAFPFFFYFTTVVCASSWVSLCCALL